MGLVTFGLSLLNVPRHRDVGDYRRHADRGDLPADYYPADDAAKTMLISPHPWPLPAGRGSG